MRLAATVLLFFAFPQELQAVNCAQWQRNIEILISEANTCWNDEDCMTVYYGCPFHKGKCHVYLSGQENTVERNKILEQVAKYKEACIESDKLKKSQCLAADAAQANCDTSHRLHCHKGQCVTDGYFLMIPDEEGKDKYGSRGVINLEEEGERDSTDR